MWVISVRWFVRIRLHRSNRPRCAPHSKQWQQFSNQQESVLQKVPKAHAYMSNCLGAMTQVNLSYPPRLPVYELQYFVGQEFHSLHALHDSNWYIRISQITSQFLMVSPKVSLHHWKIIYIYVYQSPQLNNKQYLSICLETSYKYIPYSSDDSLSSEVGTSNGWTACPDVADVRCVHQANCNFYNHCPRGQSNRARQLYKNISMLFLFPVKDGKLSTGVNATFNASWYG